MKRNLFTACSVLGFSALNFTACQEHGSPATPPIHSARAAVTRPIPARGVAVLSAISDGGMVGPFAMLEPLGLEHGHAGRVDHVRRAEELRGEGDVEGALTEARRGVFDDREDNDALLQMAELSGRAGQKTLAARAYHELSGLLPDDAVPLIQEARMRVAVGDNQGAKEAAEEAMKRDDENPEVYQVIGRALMNQGLLPGAIASFEQAVELAPDHGYALNNLGFAYLRANENEKAVGVLTRAHDLLPEVAYVANNLGIALERTGHMDGATLAYERATELSPGYLKARLNVERMRQVATAAVDKAFEGLSGTNDLGPDDGEEAADPTKDTAPPTEVGSSQN